MTFARSLVCSVFIVCAGVPSAWAACNLADAKLEEAILKKPEFRDPHNRQLVRDLRHLRDAAFILWTYGQTAECEQLLGNIRKLVAAPSMSSLGGSDEDEVDEQMSAEDPIVKDKGAIIGNRANAGAAPLIRMADMSPPIRADEILGSEVRTSDDKIVGEVRNVILGTEDRSDYAIIATGGFFVPGKSSIVVTLRDLRVSQERNSFYLSVTQADLADVPRMPDNNYGWLSDSRWITENNRRFSVEPKQDK
jgi:hypothetical protein